MRDALAGKAEVGPEDGGELSHGLDGIVVLADVGEWGELAPPAADFVDHQLATLRFLDRQPHADEVLAAGPPGVHLDLGEGAAFQPFLDHAPCGHDGCDGAARLYPMLAQPSAQLAQRHAERSHPQVAESRA